MKTEYTASYVRAQGYKKIEEVVRSVIAPKGYTCNTTKYEELYIWKWRILFIGKVIGEILFPTCSVAGKTKEITIRTKGKYVEEIEDIARRMEACNQTFRVTVLVV